MPTKKVDSSEKILYKQKRLAITLIANRFFYNHYLINFLITGNKASA